MGEFVLQTASRGVKKSPKQNQPVSNWKKTSVCFSFRWNGEAVGGTFDGGKKKINK